MWIFSPSFVKYSASSWAWLNGVSMILNESVWHANSLSLSLPVCLSVHWHSLRSNGSFPLVDMGSSRVVCIFWRWRRMNSALIEERHIHCCFQWVLMSLDDQVTSSSSSDTRRWWWTVCSTIYHHYHAPGFFSCDLIVLRTQSIHFMGLATTMSQSISWSFSLTLLTFINWMNV